ncbi:MAG: DUF1641 domain-containing protein [Burkholderiaceae bacterium]|nr:DUF1641 domain-containing protein [Burkholderiaceae bacterium]
MDTTANTTPDQTLPSAGATADASTQLNDLLHDDASLKGLQELMAKVEPLLAGGRLNRIVDLVSVTADLVDMTDAYMIEKLAKAVDDGVGAAWTAGNAARMARQQVSSMQETPTLIGLLRMAREPEVRRGLAYMLAMAGVLGKGLAYDSLDYTKD